MGNAPYANGHSKAGGSVDGCSVDEIGVVLGWHLASCGLIHLSCLGEKW